MQYPSGIFIPEKVVFLAIFTYGPWPEDLEM